MKTRMHRVAIAAAVLGSLVLATPSHAQVEDLLKQGQQSGKASGLGKLDGLGSALSGGALPGSTGNIAGLLQFCIKNSFLKGEESSSVKDKLMGKLGGTPAPDSGYAEGAQGLLKSGDGKQLDLSGGGLQAQASKQICDQILSQAKSLL
jgi:Protein of unknown function (DUF2501)